MKRCASYRHEAGDGHRVLVCSRRAFPCSPLIGIAVAAVVALPLPGTAQEDGLDMWKRGGCATCHGGFGTGGRSEGDPDGPNLRRTTLDREAVRETIACGRGEMPYHLQGAYREVSCYGLPLGAPRPPGFKAGRKFSAEQLDALVDFLFNHVVGVPLTRQTCAVYFDGNEDAPACAHLPG